MDLVLIEGAGKIAKIKSILGPNYNVLATGGHFRQLKNDGLYDTGLADDYSMEQSFEFSEQGKRNWLSIMKHIKEHNYQSIYLASDPDREGEAIAWHMQQNLSQASKAKAKRITFNEISQGAILKAIANPRNIDINYVYSQFGRQGYDKLFGFRLSSIVKEQKLKSNGRVQGVAVKLIGDRQIEIDNYKPDWRHKLVAMVNDNKGTEVKLTETNDKLEPIYYPLDAPMPVLSPNFELWRIVRSAEKDETPPKPYTTSDIYAHASQKLGINVASVEKTIQALYESGLITYPRTDNHNFEAEFWPRLFNFLQAQDLPITSAPRSYHNSASSQQAHPALRPINLAILPNDAKVAAVNTGEISHAVEIYQMIYLRTLIQGMPNARYITSQYVFGNDSRIFHTEQKNYTSLGFKGVFGTEEQPSKWDFTEKQIYQGKSAFEKVNLNKKPAPYTQASLIKELERRGIGRPSTYASYPKILLQRNYAEYVGKAFKLTPSGNSLYQFNNDKVPDLVSYDFTANLEKQLDEIASGRLEYKKLLADYDKVIDNISVAFSKREVKTEVKQETPAPSKAKPLLTSQDYMDYALSELSDKREHQIAKAPAEKYCAACYQNRDIKFTETGRRYYKCDSSRFDPKSKSWSGCPIEWINDNKNSDSPVKKVDNKPQNSNAISGKQCGDCQTNRLLVTTGTGRKYYKCNSSRFDPGSKSWSGCPIEWVNEAQKEVSNGR